MSRALLLRPYGDGRSVSYYTFCVVGPVSYYTLCVVGTGESSGGLRSIPDFPFETYVAPPIHALVGVLATKEIQEIWNCGELRSIPDFSFETSAAPPIHALVGVPTTKEICMARALL